MDLINELLEYIDYPTWIKNSSNEIIFTNKKFKEIFGMDLFLKDKLDKNFYDRICKKEIINKILNINKRMLDSIVFDNREYKHIVFSYDEDSGNLAGIMIDTTKKQGNYENSYEKNILQVVIDNIPELIFYKNKDLKYIGLNHECKKFYSERGADNVLGKTDLELPLDRDFIETCNRHDKIVVDSKKPLYIEEQAKIENSNEYNIFETIKTPIINKDGSVEGLVGVVRDITEQKKFQEKLEYLSYTDRLTGLYNRAYFDEKIQEIIANKEFPIGIIIGDANGLKVVNDTIGHEVGDELLIEMSKTIEEVFNCRGIVFRWGGDEFATILPNSTELECINLIDKVKSACEQKIYDNFRLSLSLGYALYNENDSIDQALKECEDKVYKQKIFDNKSIRISILSTLKENLQNKNIETEEHTKRVEEYCLKVGKKLNLDEEAMDTLSLVARLHDIGKIGIPEKILLKPGKLTDDEYEIMKTHSEKGYRLALLTPELGHIARGILTHHERWDGKGYPLGLEGEDIPLIARIVSVVDAYDAMTNDRVYSKSRSKDLAIKELRVCADRQFDSSIVKVFCEIIEEEISIVG